MDEHLKSQTNGDMPSIVEGHTEIYLTARGKVEVEKGKVTFACIWLGSPPKDSKAGRVDVKIVGNEFRIWNSDNPNMDYFSRRYPYEHGNNSLPTEMLMSALCSDHNNSYAIVAVKRHLVKVISKTFHKLDFSMLWHHWRTPIVTKRTPIITPKRRNT